MLELLMLPLNKGLDLMAVLNEGGCKLFSYVFMDVSSFSSSSSLSKRMGSLESLDTSTSSLSVSIMRITWAFRTGECESLFPSSDISFELIVELADRAADALIESVMMGEIGFFFALLCDEVVEERVEEVYPF